MPLADVRQDRRSSPTSHGHILREQLPSILAWQPHARPALSRPEGKTGGGWVPAIRKLATLHSVNLLRQEWKVRAGTPRNLDSHAARSSAAALCRDALLEVAPCTLRWHQEFRILRPPVAALRQLHLILTERLAVGCRCAHLVRGSVSNVAIDDDQRGPVSCPLERIERPVEPLEVVGIADIAWTFKP